MCDPRRCRGSHPLESVALPTSLFDREHVNQTESLPVSKDRRDDLIDISSNNLVAFGDFRAAQQILALSPVESSPHLTLSRFFQAQLVKTDNLILIGGKKANPWVYLFDDTMAFSLDYDPATRTPLRNEPALRLTAV